jgi:hypothetical protein
MAACDEMIGCCSLQSIRRFSRIGAGMMGDISQKALLGFCFWGNVNMMPRILWDRLHKGCKIQLRIPGFGKQGKLLTVDNILSIGFAPVSYPGQGKYGADCLKNEFAVRWEDLDPCIKYTEAPTPMRGGYDKPDPAMQIRTL